MGLMNPTLVIMNATMDRSAVPCPTSVFLTIGCVMKSQTVLLMINWTSQTKMKINVILPYCVPRMNSGVGNPTNVFPCPEVLEIDRETLRRSNRIGQSRNCCHF
uniref:Uncharacterized protein n=1 Tax=Cacopsylla melanoneura TaxID=428564 RepID=A0A8D8WZL1_9HEMI